MDWNAAKSTQIVTQMNSLCWSCWTQYLDANNFTKKKYTHIFFLSLNVLNEKTIPTQDVLLQACTVYEKFISLRRSIDVGRRFEIIHVSQLMDESNNNIIK